MSSGAMTIENLQIETLEDEELAKVKTYMESKWSSKRKQVDENLRAFNDLRAKLRSKDGILYRQVKRALRSSLISFGHRGNPGIAQMKR